MATSKKGTKKTVLSADVLGFNLDTKVAKSLTGLSAYDIEIQNVELTDFASKVIETELAVDVDGEEDTYAKLMEMGCFSPVRGMVNIRNVFDGALYARMYRNEIKRQFIEFCQQYKDGRYSPIMQVPQADMMMAARHNFLSKGIEEPIIRNRVAQFLLSMWDEYYAKFNGNAEDSLDIIDILSVLFASMSKLPVYEEEQKEMDAVQLYKLIERYAPDLEAWKVLEHSSYYMLDIEGMDKLAHLIGMNTRELLKLMKKYEFLYLTKSSDGYQANARFTKDNGESFTEWVYCIYKFKNLAGIEKKEQEGREENQDF